MKYWEFEGAGLSGKKRLYCGIFAVSLGNKGIIELGEGMMFSLTHAPLNSADPVPSSWVGS